MLTTPTYVVHTQTQHTQNGLRSSYSPSANRVATNAIARVVMYLTRARTRARALRTNAHVLRATNHKPTRRVHSRDDVRNIDRKIDSRSHAHITHSTYRNVCFMYSTLLATHVYVACSDLTVYVIYVSTHTKYVGTHADCVARFLASRPIHFSLCTQTYRIHMGKHTYTQQHLWPLE